MALDLVAQDEAVAASTSNELIRNVNGSPGRAIFTSNGNWSVPAGVHQFKVTLCGGGGGSGGTWASGGGGTQAGANGGSARTLSKIVSGQEIGASFTITVGAGGAAGVGFGTGGTGGTSTFGALLSGPGGTGGSQFTPGNLGGAGSGADIELTPTFSSAGRPYGDAGHGSESSPQAGMAGIVVIEW